MPEVVKALGITEVSCGRRKEHRGLSLSQAKQFKELERGNQGLRRAVSDLTLDKPIRLSCRIEVSQVMRRAILPT